MKFKIKKGNHFSCLNLDKLWPISKQRIHKKIKFMSTCWYPKNIVIHSGWNKLYGISGLNIHGKSARFVWQPDFKNKNYICIAAYIYGYDEINEQHRWYVKEMIKVKVEETFEITIVKMNNGWQFRAKDNPYNWVHVYFESKTPWMTFKAYPFFGGRDKAYHTMEIEIVDS